MFGEVLLGFRLGGTVHRGGVHFVYSGDVAQTLDQGEQPLFLATLAQDQ
jgi:hypothetical protein